MTRASARPWTRSALLALVLSLAVVSGAVTAHTSPATPTCAALHNDSAYTDAVLGALAASKDVWGNELLSSPDGPTYDGDPSLPSPADGRRPARGPEPEAADRLRRLLPGLRAAARERRRRRGAAARGRREPDRLAARQRAEPDALGRPPARERYGTCLSRLSTPRLADGYLPILETSYVDSRGVRYRQESFAARIPQTRALVSFVRLIVDPSKAKVGTAVVRFTPSVHLKRVGTQLRQGTRARVLFSSGARFDARGLEYVLHRRRTIYVAWLDGARRTRPFVLGRKSYLHARHSLSVYWAKRLASNAQLVVPEQRVYDAERNLLIQNMLLSWRYSLGNSYGALLVGADGRGRGDGRLRLQRDRAHDPQGRRARADLFPESRGRRAHDRRSGLLQALPRRRRIVRKVTPALRRDVESFAQQIAADPQGLLQRERYGSDIGDPIYGMHAQVLALQGLWCDGDRLAADRLPGARGPGSRRGRAPARPRCAPRSARASSTCRTGRCSSRSRSSTGWSTPTTS